MYPVEGQEVLEEHVPSGGSRGTGGTCTQWRVKRDWRNMYPVEGQEVLEEHVPSGWSRGTGGTCTQWRVKRHWRNMYPVEGQEGLEEDDITHPGCSVNHFSSSDLKGASSPVSFLPVEVSMTVILLFSSCIGSTGCLGKWEWLYRNKIPLSFPYGYIGTISPSPSPMVI